jgi:hypothetical protein
MLTSYLDDLAGAEGKGEELAPRDGGVELRSVLQGSCVVHVQRVPLSGSDLAVLHTLLHTNLQLCHLLLLGLGKDYCELSLANSINNYQ